MTSTVAQVADPRQVAEDVDALLVSVAPVIDAIRRAPWTVEQVFDLVARAIAVRQSDALASVVRMCRDGRGVSALSLVRPACEELIWLSYLQTLPLEVANRILALKGRLESLRLLNEQQQVAGARGMRAIGFPQGFVRGALRERAQAERAYVELGAELGFAQPTDERTDGPSNAFLAQKVGLAAEWNLVYSATCKAVHFSPSHLLRHAWGTPGGEVVIDARSFDRYWSLFALTWATHYFVHTLTEVTTIVRTEHEYEGDALLQAMRSVAAVGRVPAITPDELRGPWAPNLP